MPAGAARSFFTGTSYTTAKCATQYGDANPRALARTGSSHPGQQHFRPEKTRGGSATASGKFWEERQRAVAAAAPGSPAHGRDLVTGQVCREIYAARPALGRAKEGARGFSDFAMLIGDGRGVNANLRARPMMAFFVKPKRRPMSSVESPASQASVNAASNSGVQGLDFGMMVTSKRAVLADRVNAVFDCVPGLARAPHSPHKPIFKFGQADVAARNFLPKIHHLLGLHSKIALIWSAPQRRRFIMARTAA